jgi:hypothetical protein
MLVDNKGGNRTNAKGKLMTEQNQQIIKNYNKSYKTNLLQCYTKPSEKKFKAEQKIIDEMAKLGGYGYKIISYNIYNFSCAYMYNKIDTETSEIIPTLVYHTRTKRHEINLLG